MSALKFLTRRPRAPKHGTGQPAMPANAAPSPASMPLSAPVATAETAYPQAPSFTPNADNLANTQPFTAPPIARGAHVRATPRREQQDNAMLRRVRDGIQALPPAPLSRAGQFAADMRSPRKGGLPVFRSVASRTAGLGLGFCGLGEDYRPLAVPGKRSMELWSEQAKDAADALLAEAQAELRGTLAEQGRYEARRRVAADAALALGYPGETL